MRSSFTSGCRNDFQPQRTQRNTKDEGPRPMTARPPATILPEGNRLQSTAIGMALLEVTPPRRGACQALRRRGVLNAAGNGRDHRDATGTTGTRGMEGEWRGRMPHLPGGHRPPRHGFAFFASNPLRALRFRLALPLPIPCAFLALGGRENFFQSLENARKFFPIIGKNGAIFPTIGKIFSNHWKNAENFFQSLENRRKIFPIVGKLSGGAA